MNSGIGGSTAQAELAFLAPWPTPAPAITAAERLVAMVLPREGGPTMIGPRFELGSLEASLGIEAAYLVRGDKTPLQPGMCFSNEPMIVLPEAFGVRLEDHFYVTQDGAAWFTEPQPSRSR